MTQRADGAAALELQALVAAGDVEEVVARCEGLAGDPTALGARAAVVANCRALLEQVGPIFDDATAQQQAEAARVALTALATVAELRDVRPEYLPREPDLAHRLLAARDPAFRQDWVERAFLRMWPDQVHAAVRLILAGLATKPAADAYTLALVTRPGAFDLTRPPRWRRRVSVREVLEANPYLLTDDIWRLFEVEGGGENSLASHDKYGREEMGWRAALVALGAAGTLDRQRLLDASLDALQRGFAQFRAQWFSALHEALAPTPAERASRQATYLALTASPIGPTVALAIRALAEVQKAGLLDAAEVVANLGPALMTPAKGSATRAIALLAKAAATDLDLAAAASDLLVGALGHPAPEVQSSALSQLRRWDPEPPAALVDRLRLARAACHPSVRRDLDTWLGEVGPEVAAPAVLPATPPAIRRLDVRRIEWTSADRELRGPESFDELLELASASLESPGSADDLESLLTAVAAEGRARVVGDPRAATLAKRAAKLGTRGEHPARHLVARVLVAWLDPTRLAGLGETIRPEVATYWATEPFTVSLHDLLTARVEAVARALVAGAPFTPISAPTHRHGIIHPTAFAERIEAAAAAGPVDLADVTAALVRLAPQDRDLADARRRLSGSTAIPPWVSSWLEQWADHCSEDASRPGAWTWSVEEHSWGTRYRLDVERAGRFSPTDSPAQVTNGHPRWARHELQDPAAMRWAGSLVPALPAAWARVGAVTIGPTSGSREVAHADPARLDRFFDPDVPLGDDPHLLLAFALNDHRPAVQTVAVDLAIAAIDDGRLDPDRLGRQIGRLAGTGLVTPSRWGRSLGDVAGHRPAHRDAVARALEVAVAVAEPQKPQDLLTLVERWETVLLESGRAVTDPAARAALAAFTGGSKTARTAARLLALEQP